MKIYFGNTSASNPSYATLNSLFYEGYTEGVAVSDTALTGQYIIIEQQGTNNMEFREIQAWNKKSIARDTD